MGNNKKKNYRLTRKKGRGVRSFPRFVSLGLDGGKVLGGWKVNRVSKNAEGGKGILFTGLCPWNTADSTKAANQRMRQGGTSFERKRRDFGKRGGEKGKERRRPIPIGEGKKRLPCFRRKKKAKKGPCDREKKEKFRD